MEPRANADLPLVAALAAGDAGAFAKVYARFRTPLSGFLRRAVRRTDVAEDLFQETWLALARGAPTLRPETDLAAWLFTVALANMLAIANIPREFHHRRDWLAFLSSCAAMITLMLLFGLNMYPNLVYSLPDAGNSLTIYNASSSPKTLGIMLIIACIGVPVVIAYTVCIYWIFRGKVKLDRMSY